MTSGGGADAKQVRLKECGSEIARPL